MTKQRSNNSGLLIYIIFTVLEVLALAGAYILDYFTRKKMGMARYVSYKNYGWEDKYPMDILPVIGVLLIVVIAAVALLMLWVRRNQLKRLNYVTVIGTIVLPLLYVCFTLSGSREEQRSYYFISAFYGAAAFFQIIKTGILAMRCKK